MKIMPTVVGFIIPLWMFDFISGVIATWLFWIAFIFAYIFETR